MAENLSNNTESSESDVSEESSKSKKKSIGVFTVESKPAEKNKKESDSIWQKILGGQKAEEEASTPASKEKSDSVDTAERLDQVEQLSPEEAKEITQQLAQSRRSELAGDATEELSDLAEQSAAELYLERAEDGGDVEAAYAETLAEIDQIPISELDEVEMAETSNEESFDPRQEASGEFVVRSASEKDEDLPVPAAVPQPSSSRTGSGNAPPLSPSGGNASGQGPNVSPTNSGGEATVNSPSIPLEAAHYYEQRAQTRGLLVGGIVGYLIGRRRGRIKTEKRLLPMQKKLEKQVEGLQNVLLDKEAALRNAVRAKLGVESAQPLALREAPLVTSRRETSATAAGLHSELSRSPAILPPERIGHVLVAAEIKRRAERVAPIAEKDGVIKSAEKLTISRHTETLSRVELLNLSEKVIVDGTSLRKVYETNLITEKGLRRLVAEHLRGGDVASSLRRELVQHEIDFERDPYVRDKDRGNKTTLNALLQQAGVLAIDDDSPLTIGQQAKLQQAALVRSQKEKQKLKRTHVVADVSLVTVILVLFLVIIYLLSNGR